MDYKSEKSWPDTSGLEDKNTRDQNKKVDMLVSQHRPSCGNIKDLEICGEVSIRHKIKVWKEL